MDSLRVHFGMLYSGEDARERAHLFASTTVEIDTVCKSLGIESTSLSGEGASFQAVDSQVITACKM